MPKSQRQSDSRQIHTVLLPALLALVAYIAGLGATAREVYATDFLFLFVFFLFLFRYARD